MTVLDHLKLIRGDPEEMKRCRNFLLGATKGIIREVAVAHEHDDSCCRIEAWGATLERIYDALKPPVRQVAINLNPPPIEETRP